MPIKPPAISSDYYSLLEILQEFGLGGELSETKILIVGGASPTEKKVKKKETDEETEEKAEEKEETVESTQSFEPEGNPAGLLQAIIDYRTEHPSLIYAIGQTPWQTNFEKEYWDKLSASRKKAVEVLEMEEMPETQRLFEPEYVFDELVKKIQAKLKIKPGISSLNNQGLDLVIAGLRPDITYSDQGQDREDHWGAEFRYQRYLLSEIFLSLGLQRKNGSLILAVADLFTELSAELIALLRQYYNSVDIYKPRISRASSSYRFIVAQNFKNVRKPAEMIELGQQILADWDKWYTDLEFDSRVQSWQDSPQFLQSIFDFKLEVDDTFVSSLTAAVQNLTKAQITYLDQALDAYNGAINLNVELRQSEQKARTESWCQKYLKGIECQIDRIQISDAEPAPLAMVEPPRPRIRRPVATTKPAETVEPTSEKVESTSEKVESNDDELKKPAKQTGQGNNNNDDIDNFDDDEIDNGESDSEISGEILMAPPEPVVPRQLIRKPKPIIKSKK